MGVQGARLAEGAEILEGIRRRLATRQPARVDDPRVARAAVAMVLYGTRSDVELLLIQRAVRDDDPWSGHMAFPGGRRHPDDVDIIDTAVRETREEVGIDLRVHGEVIGHLDELRAMARHRPVDLVISPVVCVLSAQVPLALAAQEVESAVWVPLSFLHSPAARGSYRRTLDGIESEFPAYQYGRYTIWGLTYRILEGFLDLIRH